MEHLTNIVAEISKIEDHATMLMESAEERKNSLAKEQEKRMKDFDDDLKKKTQDQIATIQNNLKTQIQKDLDLQRTKTKDVLDAMQKEYDENHIRLATQIVKSMIGA